MKFLYLEEYKENDHNQVIIINASEILFIDPSFKKEMNLFRIVLRENTEIHVTQDIVDIWNMINV